MTSDSPSPPPDGPQIPRRHRPTLENIAKDTTELDLWAFEDDLDISKPPTTTDRISRNRAIGGELPAPRERVGNKQEKTETRSPLDGPSPRTTKSSQDVSSIRMNVIRERPQSKPGIELGSNSNPKPELEFEDLGDWDDVPSAPQIEDLTALLPDEPEFAAEVIAETVNETPESEKSGAVLTPEEPKPIAEKPKAKPPIPQAPRVKLSGLERVGLIVLLVLLGIGGVGTLAFSIMGLPTESANREEVDFPVKGKQMTIETAKSYWREPITDGSAPETFRRGTKLLPVIDLKVSDGTGAIRLLFRNSDGELEGDAVIRKVNGAGVVVIPATAGFNDFGFHAAYRAGHTEPWTVEVYEAPSETTPGKDFQKLFVMDISTERR